LSIRPEKGREASSGQAAPEGSGHAEKKEFAVTEEGRGWFRLLGVGLI